MAINYELFYDEVIFQRFYDQLDQQFIKEMTVSTPAQQFAAQMINQYSHIFTCVDSGEINESDITNFSEIPNDVVA